MAESFGIETKNKSKDEDCEFPMQIPYICKNAKMQDKDESLIKELNKSDHKYELTKIERTSVLTTNGNIFSPTAIKIVSSLGIMSTIITRALRAPTQHSDALGGG
jgi:hypothetical protein